MTNTNQRKSALLERGHDELGVADAAHDLFASFILRQEQDGGEQIDGCFHSRSSLKVCRGLQTHKRRASPLGDRGNAAFGDSELCSSSFFKQPAGAGRAGCA